MSDYDSKIIRKQIRVYGSVQGVGFRYRTEHAAESVGATGWVRNDPDGSVFMEIQGTEEQIDRVFAMVSQGTYVNIEKMEFRRKTHGNMVLRGSVHRRRLCKSKEMRY